VLIEEEIGVVFELLFRNSSFASYKETSLLVSSSQEEIPFLAVNVVVNTPESVCSICCDLCWGSFICDVFRLGVSQFFIAVLVSVGCMTAGTSDSSA
jgi:hypothetical protein